MSNMKAAHIYTDAVVYTKPCYINALYISMDTNATTDVYAYDNNLAVSGTLAFGVDPSAQGIFTVLIPEPGILCEKGLAVRKGSSHSVTVLYTPL